ncbi:MarR family winged helix-turn-helix transcriptional regulator [Leifsonia sp. LS-T14]|uniref:MarR family winged helix-turn-helix transcriptional regulator n=1 Tax=unclassified Leifsonia TaxID=2663824 RepID=UPI0035A71221
MNSPERGTSISRVQHELTTMARRGTALIRRENHSLSEVDRSLLAFIESNPGCRAVDIAAHFHLNRSTVSRQLAALSDDGLIALSPAGSGPARGMALNLTDEGDRLLGSVAASLNDALTQRLQRWSQTDIDTFASLLARYNEETGRL